MQYKILWFKYFMFKVRFEWSCFKWIFSDEARKERAKGRSFDNPLWYEFCYEIRRIVKWKIIFPLLELMTEGSKAIFDDAFFSGCLIERSPACGTKSAK